MAKNKPKSAMASLLDFSNAIEETEDLKLFETKDESLSRADIFPTSESIEVENKTSQDDKLGRLIMIDPAQCKLWRYADRPNDELGDLQTLAKSLKEHGQQEPILVRPTTKDSKHPYEIIFGNRRWRAAQLAEIKLQAICKPITDQEAALFQKEENENRKELSDYARATSYRSQIDGGVFKSETELSKFLGISKQTLNDLMSYLRVPENIRIAIRGFKFLPKSTVIKIASLSKQKDQAEAIIALADKISTKKINASNIERKVQECISPKLVNAVDVYIKRDENGKSIFKLKHQANGSIAITIPRPVATKLDENKLMDQLNEIITRSDH